MEKWQFVLAVCVTWWAVIGQQQSCIPLQETCPASKWMCNVSHTHTHTPCYSCEEHSEHQCWNMLHLSVIISAALVIQKFSLRHNMLIRFRRQFNRIINLAGPGLIHTRSVCSFSSTDGGWLAFHWMKGRIWAHREWAGLHGKHCFCVLRSWVLIDSLITSPNNAHTVLSRCSVREMHSWTCFISDRHCWALSGSRRDNKRYVMFSFHLHEDPDWFYTVTATVSPMQLLIERPGSLTGGAHHPTLSNQPWSRSLIPQGTEKC